MLLSVGLLTASHAESLINFGFKADFTWEKLGDQLGDTTWNSAKSRTNAWHVSLSYYF